MTKKIGKKEILQEELDKFGRIWIINEIKKRSEIAEKKINSLFKNIRIKSKDPYERSFNESILSVALDNAVFCYGLGLDSHCIVELYGVVEHFIIRAIKEEFFEIKTSKKLKEFLKNEKYKSELEYFIRKIKTKELVSILKKIGVLDKTDLKAFEELENLRNSFAHKNVVRISKHTDTQKIPKFFEIDSEEIRIDTKKHIENSLKILRKLHLHHSQIEIEKGEA